MNKPLILIVEDDKAVRNLMGTTLDMQEYRYHMAKNGAQALMEGGIPETGCDHTGPGAAGYGRCGSDKKSAVLVKCTDHRGKCQERGRG